jgi:hypothetical protein
MTTPRRDFNKVVRDGKVAVITTSTHNSGWFTWNTDRPELLFGPRIVEILLGENFGTTQQEPVEPDESDKESAIMKFLNNKYGRGEISTESISRLEVVWIPVGTEFRVSVHEHDEDRYEEINTFQRRGQLVRRLSEPSNQTRSHLQKRLSSFRVAQNFVLTSQSISCRPKFVTVEVGFHVILLHRASL